MLMLKLNWYFTGNSPSNIGDKIKQGVDDGSNLQATQQTTMPTAPVHWAVVRSEHADFEADITLPLDNMPNTFFQTAIFHCGNN